MTEKQAYLELYGILTRIGAVEVVKRLERGEGSGTTSCFTVREAGGKQDGVEEEGAQRPKPQELAVSPGEAKLRSVILCVQEVLRAERDAYGVPVFWWWLPDVWRARGVRETIARLMKDVRQIEGIAVKPDSEQPR